MLPDRTARPIVIDLPAEHPLSPEVQRLLASALSHVTQPVVIEQSPDQLRIWTVQDVPHDLVLLGSSATLGLGEHDLHPLTMLRPRAWHELDPVKYARQCGERLWCSRAAPGRRAPVRLWCRAAFAQRLIEEQRAFLFRRGLDEALLERGAAEVNWAGPGLRARSALVPAGWGRWTEIARVTQFDDGAVTFEQTLERSRAPRWFRSQLPGGLLSNRDLREVGLSLTEVQHREALFTPRGHLPPLDVQSATRFEELELD